MKMLGTVRISLQVKWIRPALDAAKARMDEAPRGSWDASSEVMIPKPFSCAMILPRFDARQESKYYIARHSKSLQL
ncbi:hypothetical protein F442_03458 [Phytophthora nicotianae P10297]|uniref:Uncharacterized protein n=1 Tax=Phytophthora nicotianae P10297 TaxID=1317064 RepID=W2ZYT0_PHYNI|nr:hypothetical protein F442_03458 [Phytophthora nicotianae P10297]